MLLDKMLFDKTSFWCFRQNVIRQNNVSQKDVVPLGNFKVLLGWITIPGNDKLRVVGIVGAATVEVPLLVKDRVHGVEVAAPASGYVGSLPAIKLPF
jgi:hypothetical protein